MILTTSFSVLRTLDYSKAGFDALKKTAITQLGSGATASSSSSSTRATGTRPAPGALSNGDVYTDYGLQNVWEVTRAQPYANGHPRQLLGRSIAGGFKPSTPYSNAVDQQAGHDLREGVPAAARDGLPGHHAALERPGQPVDPVPRPEPALLVCLLARRAVHAVQRLRGSGAGPAPARSTSRASTARPTSRDSWREARPRVSGRQRRSSAPSSPDP